MPAVVKRISANNRNWRTMAGLQLSAAASRHKLPASVPAYSFQPPAASLQLPAALNFGELNDHLDVVRFAVKRPEEVLWLLAARDQASQPGMIRGRKTNASPVPMPPIGIDASEDDVVLQDHRGCDVGWGTRAGSTAGADAGETQNAARRQGPHRISDHRAGARALDDDIRLESDVQHAAGVISPAERAHQFRLGTRLHTIEDVNVQTALFCHEG